VTAVSTKDRSMTAESTVVFSDRVERIAPVVTTACDDWRAAVALFGELDIANAAELRAELDRHLDEGRRVIRVDVHDVTFMDSTAIGELIEASARCRREHGSLILTNVPARVQRLVMIAGLASVLLIDTAGNGRQVSG
jgi:anti-anti-sigma factor